MAFNIRSRVARFLSVLGAAALVPACSGHHGGGGVGLPAGKLQFLLAAYSVNENAGAATITVRRVGGSVGAVTVAYATSDGTAGQPADYAAAAGTLSWADGDAADKTFNVSIVADALSEPDESVNLALSGATGGAALGAPSTAVLTLVNVGGDTTPPTVVSTVPASGAVGVALNAEVTATFSEPMININASTFTVAGVTGTVTYDPASRTATFTPGADFAAATAYTATVTTGAQDAAGIGLAADYAWSFTTGAAADTTAPTVISFSPVDASSGVSLATHAVVAFSEAMNFASVQGAITLAPPPANPLLFFWNGAGTQVTVVFDTTAPVGIEGDDLLLENTAYTLVVGTGAKDLAGNALAVAASTSFTTRVDATPPSVVSILPDPSVTLANPVGAFTVTFSEAMDTSPGTARVTIVTGETRITASSGNPSAALTVTWDVTGTILTISLTAPLAANAAHELSISNLTDDAPYLNPMDPVRRLVVTAGSDAVAPAITERFPAPGATGVSRDSAILMGFSEAMGPDLAGHVTLAGAGSTAVDMDTLGLAFIILPRQAWPSGATITVSVDAGAKDASGNAIAASSFSFTTAAGDTDPMVVDQDYSNLPAGLTDVDSQARIAFFLKFKDGVSGNRAYLNAQSLAPEDVSLADKNTGVPVKGYRLRFDGGTGALYVESTLQAGFLPLKDNATYALALNGTLRDSMDVALAPVSLEFTTRPVAGNARPWFDGTPETQFVTSGSGETASLRVEVRNADGTDTLSVTASDAPDSGFAPTLTGGGSFGGGFSYATAGADEAPVSTPGVHVITYTVTDGAGAHTATIKDRGYVFDRTTFPSLGNPTGLWGTNTPAFTWGSPPATARALILSIRNLSGAAIYQVLLPATATSFTLPADYALASGAYGWFIGLLRTDDDTGRFRVMPGLGAAGPRLFTVP